MRWAPLPSARLLPIVSRGAYRDTGYHSSVANSTPGTVAGIGSACAVPGRAYIPASSFPDSIAPPHWLGTCWYFTVTTDASEPVVPGSDCLPTPATENYERRKDPSSPCTRFFSGPVPPRWPPLSLLGSLDDERTLLCMARSSSVYDYFAMTVYIADGVARGIKWNGLYNIRFGLSVVFFRPIRYRTIKNCKVIIRRSGLERLERSIMISMTGTRRMMRKFVYRPRIITRSRSSRKDVVVFVGVC